MNILLYNIFIMKKEKLELKFDNYYMKKTVYKSTTRIYNND